MWALAPCEHQALNKISFNEQHLEVPDWRVKLEFHSSVF